MLRAVRCMYQRLLGILYSCATLKSGPAACTRLWMQKQDKAFSAWLNHMLLPFTPDALRSTMEDEHSVALTDLRLMARVQGVLVAAYRTDAELHDVMMRVEARVDEGKLKMKDEVGEREGRIVWVRLLLLFWNSIFCFAGAVCSA